VRLFPPSFFERDARLVALDLLGAELVREGVRLRITEVEAYCYPDDSANHCHRGRTARNAPMWGPGGHAYVYLCYGLHQMLNVVTHPEGEGAAVLVRACEPVEGLETVRERRGGKSGPALLTGPGKVGAALDLDTSWSGHPLFEPGGLELHEGLPPAELWVGPRVGVDYAEPRHRDAPWRYAVAGSAWVSVPKTLEPASRSAVERALRRGHGRPR
jgi:DNA-3-methyladenine glycosylase